MQNPTRDDREFQATECLRVAALHHAQLLAVATRLAGSADAGMDLYQESVLRCHDQIQSKGFHGDHFEFYLLKTIRNGARPTKQRIHPPHVELTPDHCAHLAEQMSAEVAATFSEADRLVLHLHLNGKSYRAISALAGGDHSWIRRRVEKMKTHLRTAFASAWANLESE